MKKAAISKNQNFERQNHAIKLLKSMANANRLRILQALNNAPEKQLNVGTLSQILGTSQGNTSNHLQRLRHLGFVQAKQNGLIMNYSLKDPTIAKILAIL